MAYKVKHIWYTQFEAQEAEDYFNDMARQGWRFCWANSTGLLTSASAFAHFERDKDAANFRYAADYVSEEQDEEYERLYRDAGWIKKSRLKNGLCIFEAPAGTGPLYTDRKRRFVQIVEAAKQKYGTLNPFLYIALILIGAAAAAWLMRYFAAGNGTLDLGVMALVAVNLYRPLIYGVDLITVGFVDRSYKKTGNAASFGHLKPLNGILVAGALLVWMSCLVFTADTTDIIGIWPLVILAFAATEIAASYVLGGVLNKKVLLDAAVTGIGVLYVVLVVVCSFVFF